MFTDIQTDGLFARADADRRVIRPTERLSSGFRVNRASDDAAGLAVGVRLSTEAQMLEQGVLNAGRTASALQIADGAMSQIGEALTRMKILTIAAGSENLSNAERALLDTEYQNLKDEICRIGVDTTFGGKHILGDSCAPYIPFSRLGLVVRTVTGSPTPGAAGLGGLADTGASGNSNGLGDENEFVELQFEYQSTELVTGISYDNASVDRA